MQEYPKWRYNRDGEAIMVRSAEEESALHGKWYDNPSCPEPENSEESQFSGTPAPKRRGRPPKVRPEATE